MTTTEKKTDDEMAAWEFHALVGEVLEHLQPQINGVAEKWIAEGKDIFDLLVYILVRPESGSVAAESRKRFMKDHAKSVDPQLRQAANDVRRGEPGHLPVVVFFEREAIVHVCWINPVAKGELS